MSDTHTRILLLGDVHCYAGWTKVAARIAVHNECTVIMQLGDFGYWPHRGSGQVFLDEVARWMAQYNLEMWWVDGNHENHDMLSEQWHEDGFWRLGPIVHCERGARWTWNDRSFLACGGAYSIDKHYRTPGESWWAGETITEADVIRCGTEHVDVLVSHDAPWGAQNVMGFKTVGEKDDYPESAANRKRLAAICDATTPELLVHGHYHHRNSTLYKSTRVEGFGRDSDYKSMGVLDLDTLYVNEPNRSNLC
jgi:predicted phosphodiesterase